ncbi:DNA repair protein-like protein [Hapsidospora chrysogenum ATCC 11550]|uniref:DNA repair protein-like protein n=1 Tax=Hapsidospora chrysogenum (strain ATCC 11550 / CBS 779.69 / DSM 880 / IAM 14645 / JCM 23072 / IMI 49137) TaxID=857340 RepID=A0A086TI18_HAPC1|nr:DNA repair protein-like protein [Hapsidospora chrysogenum ATCC 11550]
MAPPPDPFHWGVEEVVEALCEDSSPWTKEPGALADIIRAEEIDGRTLLTFEATCSRQELMECLCIRRARHKASLSEKLVNLRASSPAYRVWHADFRKKLSLENDDSAGSQEIIAAETNDYGASENFVPQPKPKSPVHTGGQAISHLDQVPGDTKFKRNAAAMGGDLESAISPRPSDDLADAATSGRLKKKKRIQPTNLSQLPSNDGMPWENQPAWAYLGNGKLPAMLVKSSAGLMSSQLVESNDGEFTMVPNRIPPGRRLAVNRITKQLLRRNSRREAMLINGEASTESRVPSDDDICDLSDLPSEWDDETLQEIEEERRENEANKDLQPFLSRDEVQGTLDHEIDTMTARWRERKRSKLERKAYRIWTSSRRRGTRTHEVIEARKRATVFHERIRSLSSRILEEKWQTTEEVRHQAQCLEKSLEDKLHQLWLIDTLELRTEPSRPPPAPRPPNQREKIPVDPMNELLTSSEDEDFIVPDDEELDREPMSAVELGPLVPMKSEPVDFIDLTQSGTRAAKTTASYSYIDLTSPIKPVPSSQVEAPSPQKSQSKSDQGLLYKDPPSVESLESVEEICAFGGKHWSGQQDPWRLTICMLGKLSFGRRSGIFETLKVNSDDDVWLASVLAFLSNPPQNLEQLGQSEKETVDFDISRVFLSHIRLKDVPEKRMTPPTKRSITKLRGGREKFFAPFCDFVRRLEPIFPRENQIYRTDAFDMELAEEDEKEEDPVEGTPSKLRNKVVREIVQDKDAVHLREREQRRAKDLEARRLKLRSVLATSGQVSQDKSRLIINEAKEEDQSLLYVNEEIGKSIKDHQIDGVRFLWNQIILDPEYRQGCLLAHTMGLGKTMQVITFLVAIAEASASSDPKLRSQIPQDLQRSQTLVLCPAGLVENWMDELLKWAPTERLGPLSQIDATATASERLDIAQRWAESGGVLVVGYTMFMRLADDEQMEEILLEKPSIVVADEAHMLKNPTGKLNRLTSRFKTTSRIALTGSPLANNVEEYYSMINWVAPNFLGPLTEFREVYVRDIEAGLCVDSARYEQRKALKMLQVLKDTVASKVNRATIKSCLSHDMPPKSEFVISVMPTKIQRTLYELYLNGLNASSGEQGPPSKMAQAQIFRVVNDLSLICNHPRSFHQKVLEVKRNPIKHETFPKGIISLALRETKGPDNLEPSLSLKVQVLITILDEARKLGDKVLVFSQSIFTLDYLETLLGMQKRSVCRLDGNTKIDQRQEKIRQFNFGDQEVYLISTTAGGVGLNIQGANRVVVFDSKWNPVNDQQAVGRAYRLGQKKHVFVYHLMVAGSFEEAMQSKAVFKTQLASRVVDKKNPVAWGKRKANFTQHIKEVPKEDFSGFIGKDRILDCLVTPPTGEGITKIVSTDTFEEEDVNLNLTAEERREAEGLVRMNRLRLTDPAEYEKMKEQQARQQWAVPTRVPQAFPNSGSAITPPFNHPGSSAVPPPFNHLNSSAVAPPTTSNGIRGVNIPVTPVLGPAAQPPSNGPQTKPSIGGINILPRPQQPSPTAHGAGAPIPMAGANTFFGQQERAPVPTVPRRQPSQPTPQQPSTKTTTPPRAPAPAWPFTQPQSPQKNKFEKKVAEIASRLKQKGYVEGDRTPEELAASVTEEVHMIRKAKAYGFLPDNHQWRILGEMMDQDRFLRAALAGYLSPSFLANADKKALQQRTDTLNGMSEEDFTAQLGRVFRGKDPEVRRPHTSG